MLSERLPEFMTEHNVGTFGYESGLIVNVLHWAYRDTILDGKPLLDREAFVGLTNHFRNEPDIHALQSNFIANAIEQGIHVIGHDVRRTVTIEEIKQFANTTELQKTDEGKRFIHAIGQAPEDIGKIVADYAPLLGEHIKSDKNIQITLNNSAIALVFIDLFDKNPEYITQYEHILKLAEEAKAKGENWDSIAATVLTSMADPNKNIMLSNGDNHNNGGFYPDRNVYGTLDESLRAQGWNTQTAHATHSINLVDTLTYRVNHKPECATQSDMHLWIVDTDEVVDVSRRVPASYALSNPGTLQSRIIGSGAQFSCSDPNLPTAEEYFGKQEINPLHHPEVQAAADALRAAMNHSDSVASERSTPIRTTPARVR